MHKPILLSVPHELLELVHQAMRDEGIEPTHENVHRWIIRALTFTAAACSSQAYQAICDAYPAIERGEHPPGAILCPTRPQRKKPPSG